MVARRTTDALMNQVGKTGMTMQQVAQEMMTDDPSDTPEAKRAKAIARGDPYTRDMLVGLAASKQKVDDRNRLEKFFGVR